MPSNSAVDTAPCAALVAFVTLTGEQPSPADFEFLTLLEGLLRQYRRDPEAASARLKRGQFRVTPAGRDLLAADEEADCQSAPRDATAGGSARGPELGPPCVDDLHEFGFESQVEPPGFASSAGPDDAGLSPAAEWSCDEELGALREDLL